MLKLSQSVCEDELIRICNEYYLIYNQIYITSNDNIVKKIAQNKLLSLKNLMKDEGIEINSSMLIDNRILKKKDTTFVETLFNHYKDNNNSNFQKEEINKEISLLPECAKKYYLQAMLIHISEPKNLLNYNRIAELISKSLSLDPTNFVYQQILNDIQKAINKYESELNAWRKAEQDRIDHERMVETTKKVAGGVGTVLLAILGAIAAAIAGIFACCCEACDGC